MKTNLKWVSLLLLVVLSVPLATIYRLNIEELGIEFGLNHLLVKLFQGNAGNPWFVPTLAGFLFVAGATTALWISALLSKPKAEEDISSAMVAFVPAGGQGRDLFRFKLNVRDALLMSGSQGEFHIYLDFIEPIKVPYISVSTYKDGPEWLERYTSDRSAVLSVRNMDLDDELHINVRSEAMVKLKDPTSSVRRQPHGLWQRTRSSKRGTFKASTPQIEVRSS